MSIRSTISKIQKLVNSGNFNSALSKCEKALVKTPHSPELLQLYGVICLNTRQFHSAVPPLKRVTTYNPNHAASQYNLGLAYHGTGEQLLAAKHFRKALQLNPELACAYRDLCAVLNDLKQFEGAVEAGKAAVKHSPYDAGSHYNLAAAFHGWRNFDASFSHYKEANRLQPDNPAILFDLAQVYLGRGEKNKAQRLFERVIELHPRQIESYRQLMRLKTYNSTDHEDVRKIRSFLDNKQLTSDEHTAILFILSKVYRDCGNFDEAFQYASEGNSIQDEIHSFNPEDFSKYVSILIEFFTPERIEKLSRLGHKTHMPIFIVGTPRSGTTLTEQILCSHPSVFGAGELEWVSACADSLNDFTNSSQSYPSCLLELSEHQADKLASKYIDYICSLSSGEPYVTDKMPANFLNIGLIHCLFPNARIIHCKREPRDACISMYLEYFPGVVPYSYDLYKLGAYYSQYQRLMEHWQSVIPTTSMTDLSYEDMINDHENQTRRLLEFLNLEWNESCLDFHKKQRRVFTASHLQVTQPIYSSSCGRWKQYAKFLQPLEDGFKYTPSQ